MRIFTLKKDMAGDALVLNGKLLWVKRDKTDNHLIFIDICNDPSKIIWETGPVVEEKISKYFAEFTTEDGKLYELVDVRAIVTAAPLVVLNQFDERKPIKYCDGYDLTRFTFNREISEEEFMEYLKENNYKIHKAKGWWDDESKIEGSGNVWTYKWIRKYTD